MSDLAFVCVGNAGRSQMASAFAERECARRGLDVEIATGGTEPAGHIHDEVVEVMREKGLDLSDRRPRAIEPADIEDAAYVVTMGCSVDEFRPAGWAGEDRSWELDDPGGSRLEAVRRQRDEIERRVVDLFDELEAERAADG